MSKEKSKGKKAPLKTLLLRFDATPGSEEFEREARFRTFLEDRCKQTASSYTSATKELLIRLAEQPLVARQLDTQETSFDRFQTLAQYQQWIDVSFQNKSYTVALFHYHKLVQLADRQQPPLTSISQNGRYRCSWCCYHLSRKLEIEAARIAILPGDSQVEIKRVTSALTERFENAIWALKLALQLEAEILAVNQRQSAEATDQGSHPIAATASLNSLFNQSCCHTLVARYLIHRKVLCDHFEAQERKSLEALSDSLQNDPTRVWKTLPKGSTKNAQLGLRWRHDHSNYELNKAVEEQGEAALARLNELADQIAQLPNDDERRLQRDLWRSHVEREEDLLFLRYDQEFAGRFEQWLDGIGEERSKDETPESVLPTFLALKRLLEADHSKGNLKTRKTT